MKDLIERQAAIDALKNQMSDRNDLYNIPVRRSIVILEQLPSAKLKRDIPMKPMETTDRIWGIPKRQAVCPRCDYYLGDIVFLGDSKLDFKVDDTYLEVKTPLINLQLDIPEYVKRKKVAPFSSTGRMARHMSQLGKSLNRSEKAIFLTCFIYDNPGFQVITRSTNYEEVKETVEANVAKGVQTWQANFKITPAEVTLEKYFQLAL